MKLIFVPQKLQISIKFSRSHCLSKTTFSMALLLEGLAYLDKNSWSHFFPLSFIKKCCSIITFLYMSFWEAWCWFHMLCYYFALRTGGNFFFSLKDSSFKSTYLRVNWSRSIFQGTLYIDSQFLFLDYSYMLVLPLVLFFFFRDFNYMYIISSLPVFHFDYFLSNHFFFLYLVQW